MNRRETTNAIAVMQAWVDGKGAVQCIGKHREKCWCDCDDGSTCSWDWDTFTYRIKPQPVEVVVYALIELETGRICSYHITEAMADACLVELRRRGRKGAVIQCKGTYTCEP